MADDLQFERADFPGKSAMMCGNCKSAILNEYFAANGQVLCSACADGIRRFVDGAGLGVGRFARSVVFGIGAAIAGTAVYAGVAIFAHSEWALISIAIGWFVGKAVRAGSDGRGGWRYQLLAAVLTYTSICAAYGAMVLHAAESIDAASVIGVIIMMYGLPFFGGAENFIGWLIIAFGMWQAWKMNQPIAVEITGPHAIGSGPQSGPAAGS